MPLADLPKIAHAQSDQFFLMAGPCAIEGEEMAMRIAEKVKSVTDTPCRYPIFLRAVLKKPTEVDWTVLQGSEMKKP